VARCELFSISLKCGDEPSQTAAAGRVAVVVPHGVLFRAGAEGKIRQKVLEENMLDAVVGLPANLFQSTPITVAVLVFDRRRESGGPLAKRTDVLFIDASREFQPAKAQNLLLEEHISKIAETYGCPKFSCP
jgi:type I restriction enzyme M protein